MLNLMHQNLYEFCLEHLTQIENTPELFSLQQMGFVLF